MKETFAIEVAIPEVDIQKILSLGEATRFMSYMLQHVVSAAKSKSDLRDLTVKEMKACRAKIGKDMPGVPKSFQAEMAKILWAA